MRLRAAAISALLMHLILAAHSAQAAATKQQPAQAAGLRLDTPSGYPVPRFVSLKDAETNCRIGPSFKHPVRFVFKRAGAPVLVVAESVDHWRKVRDSDGDECWAHEATLTAQTHVLTVDETGLQRQPSGAARMSGRLGAGVLARLVKRKDGWLLIDAGKAKGWTAAAAVWGGDPIFPASAGRN